ncbi:MAG: ABC transporter ATP-binding protein [Lachnospiraceae bacterium]|nr:ABC transporter ATP-binding protein [Lachnospiraceae bacterium]
MLEVTDLHIEIEDSLIPETVVHDFDITVSPGEIVGIVGESGSGKSMSAHAIAGLLSRKDMKKKGSIMFEGEELLSMPRSRLRDIQGDDIAVVFQEPMTSLNPVKTIGWQVEEAQRIHGNMSDEELRDAAIRMLRDVEIDEPERVYYKYPHELSGGMRQRVMIAAALICNPKLLIADEPTTALDVTIQAQIIELLKRINKEKGTAILFISHDLGLVRTLCSRVVVMNKGRITESGTVEEVFNHPREEYTKQLISAIPKFRKIAEASPVPDRKPILEVQNVSARYKKITGYFNPGAKQRLVVKNASFTMYEGEIIGLVGESGCGKTTLGKTILGMLDDTDGKIVHYSEMPQMIFQDPYGSLNPTKTVGWILEEPLRIKGGYSEKERSGKAREMLSLVGLDETYMKRKPDALSGGQRQRVCIALALMLGPKLIIADEPVSALDVTVQEQVINLLIKVNRELGVAILFISHDLKVVYELCSRIIVMKSGEIVEQGTDEEIYNNPQHPYTKQLLLSAGYTEVTQPDGI